MRRTADRVDEQLLTQMQARAIAGPMAGRRTRPGLHQRGSARRRAGAVRQAPGRSPARAVDRALHRDAGAACSSTRSSAIASPTRFAWRRASRASPSRYRASGRRVADDVIGYAQANNITHIIIGKSSRSRWFEILHGSVVHDLVRRQRQHQRPCHRWRRAGRASRSQERPCRPRIARRASMPRPLLGALAAVAARARRRPPDPTLAGHRERSTSCF